MCCTSTTRTCYNSASYILMINISVLRQDTEDSELSALRWFGSFSVGVWLLIFLAFLVTSLLLHLLSRVSPKDRSQQQLVSVWDSAWFLVSSCFRGSTYRPLAHSTRLLTSCWWIFSLAVIITFFTVLPSQLVRGPVTRARHQSLSSVIQDIENIGVVEGGSTFQLLKVHISSIAGGLRSDPHFTLGCDINTNIVCNIMLEIWESSAPTNMEQNIRQRKFVPGGQLQCRW